MIEQLRVIVYPSETGPSRTEVFDQPVFDRVLQKLQLMDRHFRPLLFLCKKAGDWSRDVMEVMGGDGLYFIEATDDRGFWYTPYNAFGGSQRVEIWTSDQGNAVGAKYTWGFEDARAIIEYYFRRGTMLFTYDWRSVKQM